VAESAKAVYPSPRTLIHEADVTLRPSLTSQADPTRLLLASYCLASERRARSSVLDEPADMDYRDCISRSTRDAFASPITILTSTCLAVCNERACPCFHLCFAAITCI
jgi:hypothetical protein